MFSINYKKGIVAAAVITTTALAGCQSGSYSTGNAKLNSNIDSVSYAFGYKVGQNLSKSGMDDLNPKLFAQGMNVAFSGDSAKISPLKLNAMLRRYQMQARQTMMKKQQQEGQKNQKKGQAFLKKNKSKQGVKTTESGLEYKVLKKGNGASPTKQDTVLVNYVGKHLNGKVFDQNDSVSIPLDHVIPGWQEGMSLMKEGATYKFWIPGTLAYGSHPVPGGKIMPNETLQFKVHLIKVK
jgi:FKBP-type peptidyl-prolyl cis-trans isomerase FklB